MGFSLIEKPDSENKNRRRRSMGKIKRSRRILNKKTNIKSVLKIVIDCVICKSNNSLRVYDVYDGEKIVVCEAYCVSCGYGIVFNPSLIEDKDAYKYLKRIVKNNCMGYNTNVRLYQKVLFSIMCEMRGKDFWKYILKLPDCFDILCPICEINTYAEHKPHNTEYLVHCVCGFNYSIDEDVVFEKFKKGKLDDLYHLL
jgi:hypothetical protein